MRWPICDALFAEADRASAQFASRPSPKAHSRTVVVGYPASGSVRARLSACASRPSITRSASATRRRAHLCHCAPPGLPPRSPLPSGPGGLAREASLSRSRQGGACGEAAFRSDSNRLKRSGDRGGRPPASSTATTTAATPPAAREFDVTGSRVSTSSSRVMRAWPRRAWPTLADALKARHELCEVDIHHRIGPREDRRAEVTGPL